MAYLQRFKNWLSEPINGYVIGLFRVFYGLFMSYEIANYIFTGMVNAFFVSPKINFPYEGFEWIQPPPAPILSAILYVMLGCAFLITIGVWMKWVARLFAGFYLYVLFLDKSLYNNHIYLFILLAILLSFTHADQFASIRKRKLPGIAVPRWQQFMLGAQVMCVYFFASLVKMRSDWWVLKQPVSIISEAIPADSFLAGLYKSELGINLMVYMGFSLDFFAPVLLWYKPLRKWVVIPFALFHYSNSGIFGDIGIFPFVMMASLILYFELEEIPLLRRFYPNLSTKNNALPSPAVSKLSVWFLLAYFSFQLLFPLRGLFLPNDLDYTTIGNRFSWRVKADSRMVSEFKIVMKDPATGEEVDINYRTMVNNVQIQSMLYDPRMMMDFAKMMHREATKIGVPNAALYARIKLSLNGRPPQYFINPEVDMIKVNYSPFKKLDWVIPVER